VKRGGIGESHFRPQAAGDHLNAIRETWRLPLARRRQLPLNWCLFPPYRSPFQTLRFLSPHDRSQPSQDRAGVPHDRFLFSNDRKRFPHGRAEVSGGSKRPFRVRACPRTVPRRSRTIARKLRRVVRMSARTAGEPPEGSKGRFRSSPARGRSCGGGNQSSGGSAVSFGDRFRSSGSPARPCGGRNQARRQWLRLT